MNFKHPLALGILFVSLVAASGQTINWSGVLGENAPPVNIRSDGAAFDPTLTIALGSFGSFVPDDTNYDFWEQNFKIFDTAGYNAPLGFFASSASLDGNRHSTSTSGAVDPMSVFAAGERAYLWIFDQRSPNIGAQWLLATAENWVFPSSSTDCCDNLPPVTWTTADIDVIGPNEGPVFGGTNDVRGPGSYGDPSTSPFHLQTATFVPEPGAILLWALGVFLPLATRRRS